MTLTTSTATCYHFPEMTDDEVVQAATETGTYRFLNDAGEDIYTAQKGEKGAK